MPLTQADHERHMRRAIELSRQCGVVEKTGGCFGALVVREDTGEVVSEGLNKVISESDPTWHGEVDAIRIACKKVGSPHLTGCVVYTSAQPCPMCHTTCLWARISKVYYGAAYTDVKKYGGFEDADFLGELCKPADQQGMPVMELLRDEAVKVWEEYATLPDVKHY